MVYAVLRISLSTPDLSPFCVRGIFLAVHMQQSCSIISPVPCPVLEYCHIKNTIDVLTIDCPAAHLPELLSAMQDFTPCVLEVLRVEVLSDGQFYGVFTIDSLIALRSLARTVPRSDPHPPAA